MQPDVQRCKRIAKPTLIRGPEALEEGWNAATSDVALRLPPPGSLWTHGIRFLPSPHFFRFCASASEGLARQLLNTAVLLVSDLLLACDVLERAVEAFLRSCKPGSRCAA